MSQVVLCHRQNDFPKPRPWRSWGATLLAAAVQGDGVVVEPGPQGLDVNVLLLTIVREHKLNCSSSASTAGSQQKSKAWPLRTQTHRLPNPLRYLHSETVHAATPLPAAEQTGLL